MPITPQEDTDIITSLKQDYNSLVPGFDVQTEGSPEEDIFVKAPTYGAFGNLWDKVYNVSLLQSFEDADLLTTSELNSKYSGNYDFSRKTSQKSKTSVNFYAAALLTDIAISEGSIVSTESGIDFRVDSTLTMYAVTAASYQDPDTNEYVLSVPVTAIEGGVEGNVKANSITVLSTAIPNIIRITNLSGSTGGSAEEVNADYATRFKEKIKGTDKSSYGGIIAILDDEENDFDGITGRVIVKAGSSLMIRDEGLGGMIDIYILGENITTVSEQFFYTPDELYYFNNLPIQEVFSVQGAGFQDSEGVTLNEAKAYTDASYTLDRTSTASGSYLSRDYLEFASDNTPYEGEVITVTYSYNKLINDIQNYFNLTTNEAPNGDNLVKQSPRQTVTITVRITVDQSLSFGDVSTLARSNIAVFVNSLGIGEDFNRLDIANVLGDTDGVANAELSDIAISSDDDIINSDGDVELNGVQNVRILNDSNGQPLVTVLNTEA